MAKPLGSGVIETPSLNFVFDGEFFPNGKLFNDMHELTVSVFSVLFLLLHSADHG